MEAIRSKFAIVNRRDKRIASKEVFKAQSVIEEVEFDFENALFNAESVGLSYLDVYIYYLNVWQEQIDRLIRISKFKFIVINKYHFVNKYAPLDYLYKN